LELGPLPIFKCSCFNNRRGGFIVTGNREYKSVSIVSDLDGKLYLYDLVRTKKETSKPFEH
jgi:hypothetical protein